MSPKQNLPWHPSFKLNGLSFETLADFEEFLNSIDHHGDDHERDLAEFLTQWLSPESNVPNCILGFAAIILLCSYMLLQELQMNYTLVLLVVEVHRL